MAKKYGARAYSFTRTNGVDICNSEQVSNALSHVCKKEGGIDFVVNSAAILERGPICSFSLNRIKSLIDCNYFGSVNVLLNSYKYLKSSRGQLLLFASSSYTRGRPYYAMYSSSKAAVVNLVQAVAEEWADLGIRVNCISPERTRTPMRLANFGIEDEATLLNSKYVATISLYTLLNDFSGEVVDIKVDFDR